MASKKNAFVSTCLGNNLLSYIIPQDYITDLYQFLGLSVGAEFSPEDVTLLYRKVFHLPSCTDEAHAAMQKVTLYFCQEASIKQKSYQTFTCHLETLFVSFRLQEVPKAGCVLVKMCWMYY